MNPFAPKPPSQEEITTLVREAIADEAVVDKAIDGPTPDVIEPEDEMLESSPEDSVGDTAERITGQSKLSKLIEDDFPFDESQLDAIDGLSKTDFGCLTGAAGTGKTTTTKKIVDELLTSASLSEVDMRGYWKKGYKEDDDYEIPENWIPSVCLCAFTGRATQMIKKNFPRDWHGNIMTIHRMLGYVPEFYEDWDEDSQSIKNKMRFVPSYNADFKMPWDVIIIDEAGMLGIDLWEEVRAAMKPGCRVIMIGDINQLPPVHGRSVFGFAMLQWPSWELTHVHRQQGVNNPIVDNAWRILQGRMPESDGRFQMIELKGDASEANRRVRKIAMTLKDRDLYDPIRDVIITPINGEEGSRGFQLGQLPLNREFALMFNPQSEHPRFIIDGGRERKQFAVGDKVMATKNDWEAGITNGMTGVITEIQENGEYGGDRRLFGKVEDVNRYIMEEGGDGANDGPMFSLDELADSMDMLDSGQQKTKEKRDRGPASHIVTVRFGDAEHGIEMPFASLAEVGTLMTAYVVTCHKMQGGEAPVVIIICHSSHRQMLYREWLYTAVTRASEKCIVLYSPDALRSTLNKQKMVGSTLREKVLAFNALQEAGTLAKTPTLPESENPRNRLLDREAMPSQLPARLQSTAVKEGGLAQLIAQKKTQKEQAPPPPVQDKPIRVEVTHKFDIKVTRVRDEIRETPVKRAAVDAGELKPAKKPHEVINERFHAEHGRFPTQAEFGKLLLESFGTSWGKGDPYAKPEPKLLPAPEPVKTVSQWGAVHAMLKNSLVLEQSKYLLPAPAPKSGFKFGVK